MQTTAVIASSTPSIHLLLQNGVDFTVIPTERLRLHYHSHRTVQTSPSFPQNCVDFIIIPTERRRLHHHFHRTAQTSLSFPQHGVDFTIMPTDQRIDFTINWQSTSLHRSLRRRPLLALPPNANARNSISVPQSSRAILASACEHLWSEKQTVSGNRRAFRFIHYLRYCMGHKL